jgi:acetylornithine deacetylase/succinyl-diaminopimelate desuccinylase-like protein
VRASITIVGCVGAVLGAFAQQAPDIGARLVAEPAVRSALDAVRRNEPQVIDEQVALCEIGSPSFKESQRAAAVERRFEQLGLKDVRIDKVGNVLGERPGASAHPHLVFAAHLDTVFPEGTDVRTHRSGSIISAPGIADDARGLAVMLGVIRALNDARIQTPGSITFVADVGEEGLGDLRGMRYLFNESMKGTIDAFVSVDGTGYGVTNVGVGSYRYRVTFKGPGGHSYGAFGLVNPIHALGRAVAAIADLQVPASPRTTFNVGRIGGGTSVNSIAHDAWLEMDMRSADASALATLDAKFQRAVDEAVAAESARWRGEGTLTAVKDLVGSRPAARTPESAAIVQRALSVTAALGLTADLGEGSTDANIPMSLGIPAITIDGGGAGQGAHSLEESFDPIDSWKGTQRALLLVLALTR